MKYCLLCLAVLFVPFYVNAAIPQWHIVSKESSLAFTAIQNNAPISGNFTDFTGEIAFNPEELEQSHARIIVKMDAVATSYEEVAKTLKAAEWFNSALFPTAIWEAKHFTKIGASQYQAAGSLTLKDKTLPVAVSFTLEEYGPTKSRVKGKAILKRIVFGVGQGEWKKTDTVKDEVTVDFILSATSAGQKASGL